MRSPLREGDVSKRCIVLLSGGLDSAVSLAMAAQGLDVVLSLTFTYGQKARQREVESAVRLSQYYGAPHQVIDLPWLQAVSQSTLQEGKPQLPRLRPELLDNPDASQKSASDVWVPNRNGVFVNVAGALAEADGCRFVVTGFNAEEAASFPDNSSAFVHAVNRCFSLSMLRRVSLMSYTQTMKKGDIVRKALDLGVPLHLSWSCYEGGSVPCGRCESCLRRTRAFKEAGVEEV